MLVTEASVRTIPAAESYQTHLGKHLHKLEYVIGAPSEGVVARTVVNLIQWRADGAHSARKIHQVVSQ